jgi:hypothetical protein
MKHNCAMINVSNFWNDIGKKEFVNPHIAGVTTEKCVFQILLHRIKGHNFRN